MNSVCRHLVVGIDDDNNFSKGVEVMKMRFQGGHGGLVTGSCTLFDYPRGNCKFLVDCGMKQGVDQDQHNEKFDFNPKEINFILLTHAHIDHCGLIPKLYKDGFEGEVYCTSPTKELSLISLYDNAKLNNTYSNHDISLIKWNCIDSWEDFGLSRMLKNIHPELLIGFLSTGHILGSTGVAIQWRTTGNTVINKQIVMSGDLGPNFDKESFHNTLGKCQVPFAYPDYLCVESTYGSIRRDHRKLNFNTRINELSNHIRKSITDNSPLVIPAFSVQRVQDILFDIALIAKLGEFSKNISVFIGSKSATQACHVYSQMLCTRQKIKSSEYLWRSKTVSDVLNCDDDKSDQFLRELYAGQMRGKLNLFFSPQRFDYNNFNIIVDSSGMCDGGPIVQHLKNCLPRRSKIILTGYMSENSNGANLAMISKNEKPTAPEILGVQIDSIKAEIVDMSHYYSGHADQTGILQYIFSVAGTPKYAPKNTTVFLNHGTIYNLNQLKNMIETYAPAENERKVENVLIPGIESDWFDLDNGHWMSLNKNSYQYIIQLLAQSNAPLNPHQLNILADRGFIS